MKFGACFLGSECLVLYTIVRKLHVPLKDHWQWNVSLHVRARCGFTGEVSVPTQRGEEDDRVSEHGNRTGVLGAKSCPVFPGELSDVALGAWLAPKEGEFVRNGTKAWTRPVMTISAVVACSRARRSPGVLPPLRPSVLRGRQASGRRNVVFLSLNV